MQLDVVKDVLNNIHFFNQFPESVKLALGQSFTVDFVPEMHVGANEKHIHFRIDFDEII